MSALEDLIGKPLHEIGDEELEELIMKGRLAREEESNPAGRVKKAAAKKDNLPEFNLDDFED